MSKEISKLRQNHKDEKAFPILAEIFFLLLLILLISVTSYFILHPSKVQKLHHLLYHSDSVLPAKPLPQDKEEINSHWFQLTIHDMQSTDLINPTPQKLTGQEELLPIENSPYFLLPEAHQAFTALVNDFYEKWEFPLYLGPAYQSKENQNEDKLSQATLIQAELDSALSAYLYIYQFEGQAFTQQECGRWAVENAWRYGLINRFPPGMEDLSGQAYEAALLRYVGAPHAKIMHEQQLCLEAYLYALEPRHYLELDDWWLSRQNGESFLVPQNAGPVSYYHISEEELLLWAPIN